MAISSTGSFPQKPMNYKVQILPADTTALKTLATGSADGTKINAIMVTSTDTAAHDVTIGITRTAVFYPLGTIPVAITAGISGTIPGVNMLDVTKLIGLPLDSDGNPYIFLADASDALQIKSLVTVTAAKELDFVAFGSNWS